MGYTSIIEHERLKAEIILCPTWGYFSEFVFLQSNTEGQSPVPWYVNFFSN